ncbi:hypothetical protein BO86DRAFT_392772 [Aspergillus japonicus CBS 114.51]|nr:hypothetical protein BO86DRAFT_392772 [Aspergillus japonicus CBS 114.51]RAH77315.1 hypothetical protein BO86DRAFT_392772 [Aspergillus japonicus CBS 114.51]
MSSPCHPAGRRPPANGHASGPEGEVVIGAIPGPRALLRAPPTRAQGLGFPRHEKSIGNRAVRLRKSLPRSQPGRMEAKNFPSS